MKKKKKISIIVTALGVFTGMVMLFILILSGDGKSNVRFEFDDSIVCYLGDNDGGKGKEISIGEFLIYAASIIQSTTKQYGKDVWSKTIIDEKGHEISFEEYMKREIIDQIRNTHILNMVAEEYNQELTENDLSQISNDAQTYHKNLSVYDIGNAGIDLSLILKIYKENALAEKVYNTIITGAAVEEGMTEEDYKTSQIHYFDEVIKQLRMDSCSDWSYDSYVNQQLLAEISFANLYSTTE